MKSSFLLEIFFYARVYKVRFNRLSIQLSIISVSNHQRRQSTGLSCESIISEIWLYFEKLWRLHTPTKNTILVESTSIFILLLEKKNWKKFTLWMVYFIGGSNFIFFHNFQFFSAFFKFQQILHIIFNDCYNTHTNHCKLQCNIIEAL